MSLHKLTAGDGYEYLTRQVAAMDSTEKGHTGLASYYTQKGETPGVWVGAGMAGIEGLDAGDPVTAEQMRFLFGSGHHSLARQRGEALPPDATAAQARDAIRLGQPFKVYAQPVRCERTEVPPDQVIGPLCHRVGDRGALHLAPAPPRPARRSSSAVRPCTGRRECLRGSVAATPSGRRTRRSAQHGRVSQERLVAFRAA